MAAIAQETGLILFVSVMRFGGGIPGQPILFVQVVWKFFI
jgi:hypothetical protein